MKQTFKIEIESKSDDYDLRKDFRTKIELDDQGYIDLVSHLLIFIKTNTDENNQVKE